jgi:excinuclease ABC subunit B
MTGSMKRALDEMSRRRIKQEKYNRENKITPKSIVKAVHELEEFRYQTKEEGLKSYIEEASIEYAGKKSIERVLSGLDKQMRDAADNLDYELAAVLRDKIYAIREMSAKKKK